MRCNTFSTILAAVMFMAVSMAGSEAWAAQLAVNVDINDGGSNTYSGAGAAPIAGTSWNGVSQTSPGTLATGALTEADGATNSGVTFSVSNYTNTYSNAGVPGFAPNLFYDFAYTTSQSAGNPANFSINNVPAGIYNLYLYSLNGNGGNSGTFGNDARTDFVVNGVTQTVQNPTSNSADPSYHGFVLGGNYTLYSGLTVATAGGSITGSFYDAAASAASLNGFQLVAVPEPPSMFLLACAGVLVGSCGVKKLRSSARQL
jgi:hypothetical protein